MDSCLNSGQILCPIPSCKNRRYGSLIKITSSGQTVKTFVEEYRYFSIRKQKTFVQKNGPQTPKKDWLKIFREQSFH